MTRLSPIYLNDVSAKVPGLIDLDRFSCASILIGCLPSKMDAFSFACDRPNECAIQSSSVQHFKHASCEHSGDIKNNIMKMRT